MLHSHYQDHSLGDCLIWASYFADGSCFPYLELLQQWHKKSICILSFHNWVKIFIHSSLNQFKYTIVDCLNIHRQFLPTIFISICKKHCVYSASFAYIHRWDHFNSHSHSWMIVEKMWVHSHHSQVTDNATL